jgi:DNA-binding response OmpR family regulator
MPHLLLVDDDDQFRESLSLNLVDEGYKSRVLTTAETHLPI